MKLVKKHWFILLFFGAVLWSCDNTSDAQKAYEQNFNEVLRVHDEVMPKMGELNALSMDLKKKIDADSTSTKRYAKANQDLENAYDFMMEWMHGFTDEYVRNQPALDELSEEEILSKNQGLEQELEEVRKMKNEVNSSMEHARTLLKE